MADKKDAAMDAMAERRDAALGTMAEKRDAALETMADAKEAAAEAIAKVKPRLRGVSHEYAFFVSLALGAVLIILANGANARASVAIYAASLSALFGVSALYHRVDWKRPSARRWMRRLDHTMIFFLIAGTLTPFAVLVMEPPLATALLIAVWGGALAGTIVELVWTDSPKWISASVYVAVGLIGAVGFPAIIVEAGHRRGHPDRRGRCALRHRRGGLRGRPPRPVARNLRLPRDLSRARDRRCRDALRGGRVLRAARRVDERPTRARRRRSIAGPCRRADRDDLPVAGSKPRGVERSQGSRALERRGPMPGGEGGSGKSGLTLAQVAMPPSVA